MNKQLLLEISRIHEIMGVTPIIPINEQKYGIIDIGMNFLNTIMKGVDRGLIKLGPTISRESFEQRITQILQRAEDGLPLSAAEQKLFSRVASQILPDLTKQAFEQSFIPSVREIGTTIPTLGETNLLKVLRNPKVSDDKVVDALWKAYGGGTKNPLIPNLTKEDLRAFRNMAMNDVRGSIDDTPIEKLPKPRPVQTDNFVNNRTDEVPPEEVRTDEVPPEEVRTDEVPPEEALPDETRTDVNRYINTPLERIPFITPQEIDRLTTLNNEFPVALRKIRQYIIDTFTGTTRLQDEVAVLARSFADLGDNSEAQVAVRKRIQSLIEKISNRSSTAFDEVKTFIENQIRPYDLTTYQRIANLDSYTRAQAILGKTALKDWITKYGSLSDRRGKMWSSLISDVINPGAWFGKSLEKYKGPYVIQVLGKWKDVLWSGPEYRELRAYLATGQTKNWEMMKEYAEKMGGIRLSASVSKEFAYNYIITAVMISFVEYIRDIASYILQDTFLADYWDWISKNKNNLKNKGVDFNFGSTGMGLPDSLLSVAEGLGGTVVDYLITFSEELMKTDLKLPGIVMNYLNFYGQAKKDKTSLKGLTETVNEGDTLIEKGKSEVKEIKKDVKYKEDKPSFLMWCGSKGLLPAAQNSWDDVNKIGTTNDGKQYKLKADGSEFVPYPTTPVVTTDTEEIKNQLYNYLKTIPSLNTSSTNKIGPNDKPYIFDKGNNLWEFQSAGDSTMKFQYNPQTKTFSQIR